MNIAIIPARSGSKRVPNKNIRNFMGKPILSYSIESAFKSHCFDEVMVSTESSEIAKVALSYGAKVPFMRSLQNADDLAMFVDVLKEVLEEYKKRGVFYDYMCCILATAPLLMPEVISKGFELLKDTGAYSVVPVVRSTYPIHQAFRIVDGKLEAMWPEYQKYRTQDLEVGYFDCGAFFWIDVKKFLLENKLHNQDSIPLVLPDWQAQDIDTMDDWLLAEKKYEMLSL